MRIRSLICSAIWSMQLICVASTFADINSTYLQGNTKPSGGIFQSDDTASPEQSTAQSLLAMKMLGKVIDVEPHILMIESQSQLETSTLSTLIKIKRYSNIDAQDDMFDLLSRQNIDGGFGSYLGYDSTPLDTANAIEALGFANDYQHDTVGAAVLFLLEKQNSDGGWSLQSNESSVYVTSAVLAGLRYYTNSYNLNSALVDGRSFLLTQKKSDGTYHSNLESAYALLGIIPITIDSTQYSDTLIQLKNAQALNFSWDEDTYTTALALQALALSKSLTLPSDPSQSYVQGTMIDRSSGSPIENALISTNDVQALTNAKGEFGFVLTDTGSYPITFSANGYDPASMTLNLAQIKNVNLGELSLNPNPINNTYSSLQGVVTDKNTGQPIADTDIVLSGQKNYEVKTNVDGRYSISIEEQGTYQLMVNSAGYHSTELSIALSSGNHFKFSPVLTPIDETNVIDVSISAAIVDATTGAFLQNVSVNLTQDGVTKTLVSDENGEINTDQLEQGEVKLYIDHAGYNAVTLKALLAQGQNVFDGNIELTPIDPTALYTTVSGKILDAELGLPLENVEIALNGPDSKRVTTSVNGDFTAQINAAGQYGLVISKAGYQTLSTSMLIELGKQLIINTSMALEGSESPLEINLIGQAIDSVTGQIIPNAKLILSSETEVLEGLTDIQGNWLIEEIPTGNVILSFSADGYRSQTANMIVAPGSNVDIGQIKMSLLPSVSQISGIVVNQQNGEPLVGAQVSLPGLQLSTTTDAIGVFVIDDISDLSFDIVVSAPGFVTNTRTLQLAEHQNISVNLDIEPVPENEAGIGIRSSVSDQIIYGAYQKALINVDLYNHNNEQKALWFVVQIKQGNRVLQEMPIGHLELPADIADTQILLAPNTESLAVQFEWLTQNLSPGDYQLVLSALDLQTRQQLASSQANVTIEPSSFISGFESIVTPRFSNFEASENLELFVRISHTSNEEIDLQINFELLDPTGLNLRSGILPVTLEAGSKIATYSIASFAQFIEKSGRYRLLIDSNLNGEILTSESVLEVAPKVRVDAQMSITPDHIIPDGTPKKIHVDLKLSGRNEG